MSSFISQLPALLGVIIGAAGSYLTTSASARAQWSRSQEVRWEDKRLQVYSDYSYAAARVGDLCHRLARSRGLQTSSTPMSEETGLDQLTSAAIDLNQQLHKVQLVGDPATVETAQDWRRKIGRMEVFAHGEQSDPALWREATGAAREARLIFYQVARNDLKITTVGLKAHVQTLTLPDA